jgi:hypothetical protein
LLPRTETSSPFLSQPHPSVHPRSHSVNRRLPPPPPPHFYLQHWHHVHGNTEFPHHPPLLPTPSHPPRRKTLRPSSWTSSTPFLRIGFTPMTYPHPPITPSHWVVIQPSPRYPLPIGIPLPPPPPRSPQVGSAPHGRGRRACMLTTSSTPARKLAGILLLVSVTSLRFTCYHAYEKAATPSFFS